LPGQSVPGGAPKQLDEKQKKDMTGFFQGLIKGNPRSKPVSGPGSGLPAGSGRMTAAE
jgi:hypothetical protein